MCLCYADRYSLYKMGACEMRIVLLSKVGLIQFPSHGPRDIGDSGMVYIPLETTQGRVTR